MTTTAASFFGTEENQATLRRFAFALESTPPLEPPAPNVVAPLTLFFKVLAPNTGTFDQHCGANIEWIGQHFIAQLNEFAQSKSEKRTEALTSIFTAAYRFLCELEFSQPGDLSFELRGVKTFVEENLERFVGIERQQLVWTNYVMPANITKKLINSPALAEFKAFAETAKAATDLKAMWDKELGEKDVELNALRDGLSRITTTYNFVGLVRGFESLASAKTSERSRSFFALLALGVVMVAPVVIQLWFTVNNISTVESIIKCNTQPVRYRDGQVLRTTDG